MHTFYSDIPDCFWTFTFSLSLHKNIHQTGENTRITFCGLACNNNFFFFGKRIKCTTIKTNLTWFFILQLKVAFLKMKYFHRSLEHAIYLTNSIWSLTEIVCKENKPFRFISLYCLSKKFQNNYVELLPFCH